MNIKIACNNIKDEMNKFIDYSLKGFLEDLKR